MKKIDVKKSTIFGIYADDNKNLKLGTRGYFSHYNDFEIYTVGELDGLTHDTFMSIQEDLYGDCDNQWYDYFIPEDKVVFKEEKKEKKLRPYKIMQEFPWLAGDVLKYRSKSEPSIHILASIESIATQDGYLVYVYMDGLRYTPVHLLTEYEYLNAKGDEWLSFGVEE